MSDAKRAVDRADQERMTKALHAVVTDDAFLDVLVEAQQDVAARKQFKTDPKAHLKRKGRDVPDDVNVEINDDTDSWGVRLSMKGKNGATAAVNFRSGAARGTETDPKDRESFRRLSARVRDNMVENSTVTAIEEALADPVARGRFNADPKGYLRSKGSDIAEEIDVKVSETPNPGWCLILCIPWWIFLICWWECFYWPDIDIQTHS